MGKGVSWLFMDSGKGKLITQRVNTWKQNSTQNTYSMKKNKVMNWGNWYTRRWIMSYNMPRHGEIGNKEGRWRNYKINDDNVHFLFHVYRFFGVAWKHFNSSSSCVLWWINEWKNPFRLLHSKWREYLTIFSFIRLFLFYSSLINI